MFRFAVLLAAVSSLMSVGRSYGQCTVGGDFPVSLFCTGTSGPDVFVVTQEDGNVKINGSDPSGGEFPSDLLEVISVSGLGGDDVLNLAAVSPPGFGPFDLPNAISITGGDGDDEITGSWFADLISGGGGCDVIDGGNGNDQITDDIPPPCTYGCTVGGDGEDELTISAATSPDYLQCGQGPLLPPIPAECTGVFSTPDACTDNAAGTDLFYEDVEKLNLETGGGDGDLVDVILGNMSVFEINVTDAGGVLDEVGIGGSSLRDWLKNRALSPDVIEVLARVGLKPEVAIRAQGYEIVESFDVTEPSSVQAKTLTGDDLFETTGFVGVEQFMQGGDGADTLSVDTLGLGAQDLGGMITFDVADPITYQGFEVVLLVADLSLPVELVSFDAIADGDRVRLFWTTASEQDNAGFDIEQQLESGFAPLGFVAGHGTTTEMHHYSFLVNGLAPGNYKFRLKQIDFDGTFAYSGTAEAAIEVPGSYWIDAPHPNPFRLLSMTRLAVASRQRVSAILYDPIGRPVRSVFAGVVEVNTPTQLPVDGSQLTPGAYFLRVVGETFTTTTELLRVR